MKRERNTTTTAPIVNKRRRVVSKSTEELIDLTNVVDEQQIFQQIANKIKNDRFVTPEFVEDVQDDFNNDPYNILGRNAVVSVGSILATTDSEEARKISHVFLNTIKKKDLKATNQGSSGRCWLFSGLNVFRHGVIQALGLENFEFSETYLFFWDKFERSNSLLQWYIDNVGVEPDDRYAEWMMAQYMTDGGWYNWFANLVDKYGVVPKSAMPETYQSDWSDEMNTNLEKYLISTIIYMKNTHTKLSADGLIEIKHNALRQIYGMLVKYLGEPPKEFNWLYTNEEDQSTAIMNLSPQKFTNLMLPDVNMDDFITLMNAPTNNCEFYKKYVIDLPANVQEGAPINFINLPISELRKYAQKSILAGAPVWFGADVANGFHPWFSSLNEDLIRNDILFGDMHTSTKGEKIKYRLTQANHAMVLTGVNIDEKSMPVQWQVENSWGFVDEESPGLDGFLTMTDKWFGENVIEIVVHKNFLSRNIQKLIDTEPIVLQPWDCQAPATFVKGIKPNKEWKKKVDKR